jgi:hypothetical protein
MDYDGFTRELTARLAADDRVAGLVAAGSMAAIDYEPDAWSDHDFFVVSAAGGQEELRADLSWLPHGEEVLLSFRETEHGLKVLYRDGHLLEFAVFDLEEIALASVNRYRVLLDRGGVAERMSEVASLPPRESFSDEYLFGMFVTAVQVGLGRTARGERLSGSFFCLSGARHLCRLIARHVPAGDASLLDEFDALRRFERVYPELGAEIHRALPDEPLRLLDVAERELRPRVPDVSWAALDAVRARAGR